MKVGDWIFMLYNTEIKQKLNEEKVTAVKYFYIFNLL